MRPLPGKPFGRTVRAAILSLSVLLLAGAVWAGIYWARYPKVPNVSQVGVDEAMEFVGTDDFNRMAEWHRKRYMLAVTERMRHDKTFADLVSMMLNPDPSRRKVGENIGRLTEPDRREVGGAFMRLFLDKFFECSKTDRDTYTTMLALAEKTGKSRRRPATGPAGQAGGGDGGPKLPSSEQIEKGMSDFLSQQPPHTVAQMEELMIEMNKKRQMLGIKTPLG